MLLQMSLRSNITPMFTMMYNLPSHILNIHLQDLKTAGVMPIGGRTEVEGCDLGLHPLPLILK